MTSFLDGPAKGQALGLKNTPELLRVCQDRKGNLDALDAPGDSAAAGETIYVYVLVEKQGNLHVCRRGKGGSGWYGLATYKLYATQPPQDVLTSNMAWAEWAREQYAAPKVCGKCGGSGGGIDPAISCTECGGKG